MNKEEKDPTLELTIGEEKDLKVQMKEVDAGLSLSAQGGLRAGTALAKIRDGKLYRAESETFEKFCKKNWGWNRNRAYQLIEAVEVKKALPENVSHGIQNERQARELSKVPEEKREDVMQEVLGKGPVTSASIKVAAEKVADKLSETKKEKKIINLDKVGRAIPESILADWQRAERFADVSKLVSQAKCAVEKGLEDQDVIFAEIRNDTIATLKNAYQNMIRAIPYAVCTSCQGHGREKCTLCKKRGFLSKFLWDSCIPEETKAIIAKSVTSKK